MKENKITSSVRITETQKEAMQIIDHEIGIKMTNQIKHGLDKFLYGYCHILERHGYEFDETGAIRKK